MSKSSHDTVAGYVVALSFGVPMTLLMLTLTVRGLLGDNWELTALGLSVTLGTSAAIGSALAVIGMQSRPRRFRTAALLLTTLPALAAVAGTALTTAYMVMFMFT
ncbi:hypothetical protein [Nocardioides allogilvus]|uniref:hypothetical protein n=1 Tax=Nocardioides allogilvus TaxID=2072017 RepID=UPI000D305D78|nr:hypothetical protein [Nocardioides allogilvus]